MQRGSVSFEKIRAEDVFGGAVHQIPIVHAPRVFKVEINDFLLCFGVFFLKLSLEDEQAGQSFFVEGRIEQFLNVVQFEVHVPVRDRAGYGDGQS